MFWGQIRWELVDSEEGGALHTSSIAASPYPESSSPNSLACHFCFWFPESISNPKNIMYFVLRTFQVHISKLNWLRNKPVLSQDAQKQGILNYWSTNSFSPQWEACGFFPLPGTGGNEEKWWIYINFFFLGSNMVTSCQSLYLDKTSFLCSSFRI